MQIERVQKIFEDIKDLRIELPRDPAALGPEFLRENIALCRNYLNKVSYFLQEVMEEAHLLNMNLDEHESEFQIRSDELLAGDPRVKNLPAVEDRLAMINVLLSDEARALKRVKREITNLKHVDKVVRHRKGELDNTMSTLRLQTSLLRDQLRSGLSHGDDTEDPREEARARATGEDDLNLDEILDEAAAELDNEGSLVKNVDGGEETPDSDTDPTDDEIIFEEDDEPTLDELAEEAKRKKAAKKAEKKKAKKPEKVPEKSEEDELLEGLDDLIDEGGIDDTPDAKPLPDAKAQDVGDKPKADPNPLKAEDIDPEMERFLNEEPGDDLDALLGDI